MERSRATGVGNTIKLFLIDLAGATDVSGIALDNIEGIAWGKILASGRNSLVLVSDNNFSTTQVTQFLAFEVEAIPAPAGLTILLIAVPALVAARRRMAA